MIPKKAIFNHIPKTAGSTIRGLIAQNYSWKSQIAIAGHRDEFDKLKNMAFEEQKKIRIVHGHAQLGIKEMLHPDLQADFLSFVIFRNPVDRYISEVKFQMDQKLWLYKIMIRENYSVADLVKSYVQALDNVMVRYLSGTFWSGEKVTEEQLSIAKKNLTACFDVFGIAERFDESVLLIAKTLNWAPPVYIRKNLSEKSASIEINKSEIEPILLDTQSLDMNLYQFAVSLFDELVSQQHEDFKKAHGELTAIIKELHKSYDAHKHKIYDPGLGPDRAALNAAAGAADIRAFIGG